MSACNGVNRHAGRATPGRFFVTVMAMLLSLAASGQNTAGWETTDWHVDCYAPTSEFWGDSGDGAQASLDTYLTLIRSFGEFSNCDETAEGSSAWQARQQLRSLSDWLSQQGFPPPNLRRDARGNRYEAYIVPPDSIYCYLDACVDGSGGGRSAYLFAGSRTPAENEREPNMLFIVPGDVTGSWVDVAHELFHGVQHAFAGVEGGTTPDWLLEGTAQAVGLTWQAMSSARPDLSLRHYSERLDRDTTRLESYNDEVFWRSAALNLNRETSYAFLIPVFTASQSRDGLAAVYAGLESSGGLAAVYTDVIAQRLQEDRFYNSVEVLAVRPAEPIRQRIQVEPVGAAAFRIVPGARGDLTIRISPQADQPAYRLIVDGTRHDGLSGRERNATTRSVIGVSDEVFVQVVNVAATADAAAAIVPIEIELQESGSWVSLNSEVFGIEPSICNSQGVVANPTPGVASVGFSIMARGGSTRVAWNESGVSANLFRNGCDVTAFPYCRPDEGGYAGGSRPADNPPALFSIVMSYDPEQGIWEGSGTLQNARRNTMPIEFSIQCAASQRVLIR